MKTTLKAVGLLMVVILISFLGLWIRSFLEDRAASSRSNYDFQKMNLTKHLAELNDAVKSFESLKNINFLMLEKVYPPLPMEGVVLNRDYSKINSIREINPELRPILSTLKNCHFYFASKEGNVISMGEGVFSAGWGLAYLQFGKMPPKTLDISYMPISGNWYFYKEK